MIKSIEIKGLFDTTNVLLNLRDQVNIYVGENGLGKTTILNIINNLLQLNLYALSRLEFEKIIIKTTDGKQKTISKSSIVQICYESTMNHPAVFYRNLERNRARKQEELKTVLKPEYLEKISQIYKKYSLEKKKIGIRYFINTLIKEEKLDYDSQVIDFFRVYDENFFIKNIIEIYDFVNELHESILYFPTYRRIETDLQNLDFSEDFIKQLTKNHLINFGMDDVETLLDNKLKDISNGIKQGFSKMALTLLNTYAYEEKLKLDKVDDKQLSFILSILSNEINENLKNKIYSIISNQNIDYSHDTLINILNELSGIYKSQENSIESIDNFVNACNNYFTNKKLVFDKENMKVNIFFTKSSEIKEGRQLNFSNLSSGEKQIVSLFSKLYLANESNYFILFDEPELSLSIDWQRKLIPDIMNSKKCSKLIVVTHSPFIFDNEYRDYAKALTDTFSD